MKRVPGTRSAFSERVVAGRHIRIDIDLREAARLGLNIDDVQEAVGAAVGGSNVGETVEGRERYPINLRYLPAASAIRWKSCGSCRS